MFTGTKGQCISSCFISRALGIQLKLKVKTSYVSVIPSCEGNSGVAHVYSMREENPTHVFKTPLLPLLPSKLEGSPILLWLGYP